MPQYSDLPKGAVPYSDLPPGAVPMDESAPGTPKIPNVTLSAAQPPSWGTQLEEDLREGGGRTFVGRGLGYLQGRGDKGYSGLESGVSPGAAQYAGSPELGIAKVVQGVQDVPQHPIKGALRAGEGVLQAATIPSAFMGGPAINAAADAAPEMIPTVRGAGRLFRSVMEDAADQPVTLKRALDPLERTQQLAERGAQPVRAADQLYRRVNTINPLTYREARDFASNLSGLSREEQGAMNPTMGRAVKQLNHAFKQDVGDAASSVGRGDDYNRAMSEYARAARRNEAVKNAAKVAIPTALKAAGVGAAGKMAWNLFGK